MQPTKSEATILHAVLSTAIATLIGASTAATQFYFNHGQNLWLSLVFFGGSLPATFATLRYAVWHAIQTSPVLPQAEHDLEAQAQAVGSHVAGQLGAWLESRFTALENVVLFHQHPATPVPSTPPQKPVAQSNAPANVAYPQTQTITYNAGVPGTAVTTSASPQLLNTFPIMPAMPAPPRG